MDIEETKVGLEVAKLLKKVGFKEGSFSTYHEDGGLNTYYSNGKRVNGGSNMTNGFEAPTQSLAQKWLRDIHNIHILPHPYIEPDGTITGYFSGDIYKDNSRYEYFDNFPTYEEALEFSLKQACLLVWNK